MNNPTNNLVAVNDLDQFVQLLSNWHKTKVQVLNHMLEIPDTAEVSLGDGPGIKVEGDFRKGFQLGLSLALSELGELPFVAELEDAAGSIKH